MFVGIIAVIALLYMCLRPKQARSGGTSDNDIDPIDFDDYDEDIGFQITINGKHEIFSESAYITVPADAEIELKIALEPEDMNGNLVFGDLPSNQRAEWNYRVHDDSTLSHFDIVYDGDTCRIIHAEDETVDSAITIDCMIIVSPNDERYMASCYINFKALPEVPAEQPEEETPLVQLEQK